VSVLLLNCFFFGFFRTTEEHGLCCCFLGTVVEQIEESIYVIESIDGLSLWTASAAQLKFSGPTGKAKEVKEARPERRKKRKRFPAGKLKEAFLSCLSSEFK